LLVILTAVCCENKKHVQFNINEIDSYANAYSGIFRIVLWLQKYVKTAELLLIACLLTAQQHHHNTLAHQYPTVCLQHSSTTTTF
jgi:hypothetical protein